MLLKSCTIKITKKLFNKIRFRSKKYMKKLIIILATFKSNN